MLHNNAGTSDRARMRVSLRIQTGPERTLVCGRRPNRRLAELGAALLWPLALFCASICAWRWSYDLSWTGQFPFLEGLASHWQVWFVAGGALHLTALRLRHYAGVSVAAAPASQHRGGYTSAPFSDPVS